MTDLTAKEFEQIIDNTCPDCSVKGEFLAGLRGGTNQNITCAKCHMRFNVSSVFGERIGKEERLRLDPISLMEGTMSWRKDDSFEYLIHSCGGSLELHKIDHEISALLCRSCGMRQVFRDKRIVDMNTSSYKNLTFFKYVRDNNPLIVGSSVLLKRINNGC